MYTKNEIDDKFTNYTSKEDLNTKLSHDYYNCDEIDQYCLKVHDAENDYTSKNEFNELKAKVSALESNSISKDSLMNIFAKSLMYNANNVYRNTTLSYETLSLQYVVYGGVFVENCWFDFAKSNERFMIMHTIFGGDNDDRGGYVIVYDFKAMSGTFFYYSAKVNYNYRIAKLTGAVNGTLYINESYADTH